MSCTDDELWLNERRDERLSEFAPPSMYAADSAPLSSAPQQLQRSASDANQRPQKRSLYGSKSQHQFDAASGTGVSTNNITSILQSIRSNVEQSEIVSNSNRDTTAATRENRSTDEVQNPSAYFTALPSSYVADVSVVNDNGASFSVSFDNQMTSSSWTDPSLLLEQFSSTRNMQEPFCGTLPSSSSSPIYDTSSTVCSASLKLSEAEITTGSFDIGPDNPGPQPAHYSSAPSAPQAKMPKYERIFLHDLPLTLPLPPTAGSSNAQYPSQEEVIGPKRGKEPHELAQKDSIRNWYRQFDQKRTKPVLPTTEGTLESDDKNQLLKPKNIPFASPYIQANDTSCKVMDDPAAKEFDPSKPPPSVSSNST